MNSPGWGRAARTLPRSVLAALAVSAILSCASRTSVQKAGEDQEIARDICWELRKDPRLEDVSVYCVDRVVTLGGRVDGKADAEKAFSLAQSMARGAEVVNRIEVRPR